MATAWDDGLSHTQPEREIIIEPHLPAMLTITLRTTACYNNFIICYHIVIVCVYNFVFKEQHTV